MSACTFFGHRDCPESIKPALFSAIEHLIISNGVRTFYVGNQGNFDRLTASVLRDIKALHPDVEYCVVLAYLPQKAYSDNTEITVYPEGIEIVPRRFAIDFRNRWMVEKSDYVMMRFTNDLLDTAIERFGTEHLTTYAADGDDHFVVSADVDISPQFFGWLCGLGSKVTITHPKDVAELYQNHLKDVLKNYKT